MLFTRSGRKRYTSPSHAYNSSHAHNPKRRSSLNAGGKHNYNVTKIITGKRLRESSIGFTIG